jgi:hypothetical protein
MAAGSAEAPLEMRVVVGTAVKTETPLFVGQMRYLEFNPYWNVPRSILDKEILPKLERNHAYLAQNEMETVPPARAWPTSGQAGRACASARGRRTHWGRSSSRCPTRWTSTCTRPRRASCSSAAGATCRTAASGSSIRPPLAQFVLGQQRQWNADAIQGALQPGPTRHVDLVRRFPS